MLPTGERLPRSTKPYTRDFPFRLHTCLLYTSRKVPRAVCGDPESRKGIILAKNELAKQFNVTTTETVWQAKKKCPDLVLVRPHHDAYQVFSKKVNAIYARYTEQVEPFGIDESWLDVTGSRMLFGLSLIHIFMNL